MRATLALTVAVCGVMLGNAACERGLATVTPERVRRRCCAGMVRQ